MKTQLRGLTALFLTLLLGSTTAQTLFDGPFVGDITQRILTRKSDWYCDLNRIVGCTKFGHVCYIQFIYGDEECDPLVAQSTRCPTEADAEECFDHSDVSSITHFQGFTGTDKAVAGLKFYADEASYLIGSDEGAAFDSGLQAVEGNIVGLKYERTGEFDFVGLILSEIKDEEKAEAIAASQAVKAELMEQYNAALRSAAEAEAAGDTQAAEEFNAEATRVYQLVLAARSAENQLIASAEFEFIGLPLWAVIVICAGIVIFIILMIVMVIYCIRKSRANKDQGTLKVTPTAIPQSADTEKDSKQSQIAEFYSQNQATDVNMESGDNKPSVSENPTPNKDIYGN